MPPPFLFRIAPLQGALCRWAIAGWTSLLVGCGSRAHEEPPAPGPASSGEQEIVGGTDTTISANPWQVSLQDEDGDEYRGGSILGDRWILTAQHCVRDDYGNIEKPHFVVAGVTALSDSANRQVRHVATDHDVIPFPGYQSSAMDKDVALLRLSTPLDLSGPDAKAIPFATAVDESSRVTTPGVVARATGWGRLTVNGPSADTLQTVDLLLLSNSAAQAAYPDYVITPDMIGAAALGKSTCKGDSGGPLTVPYGDSRVLVGVNSWKQVDGCGDSRYPSMFARVSSFATWITETTCILSNGATPPNSPCSRGCGAAPTPCPCRRTPAP